MASRSSSWLVFGSFVLVCSAAGASCGSEKPRPPSLTNSSSTTTSSTSTGIGGSGGEGTGGNGGAGGGVGGMGGGGMPETCGNAAKDGDETDIDCGGSCSPCGIGQGCLEGDDCVSKSCKGMLCALPSCFDEVQNQTESDVDCGGSDGCPRCEPTQKCSGPDDCVSLVCTGGQCVQESCSDGVLNGSETDIDCGGAGCAPCPLTKACVVNSDCVTHTCNSAGGQSVCACPLGMVVVIINGGGSYCMDTTEVTYAQYQVFYDAGLPASVQPASCIGWNQNFTPTANWGDYLAKGKSGFPVTNVNWCDAYTYCQHAGKHLCGKIGGGPNATVDHAVAEKSEWFNACSAQGNNIYPYGNMFVSGTCNGESCLGTLAEADVKITLCQGGTPKLQQMSGNAAEWEDSCDADVGAGDLCRVRGGSDCSNAQELRCDADAKKTRDFADDHTGFRCCL
jgi:hypothetical protein